MDKPMQAKYARFEWPTAEGKILSSDIRRQVLSGDNLDFTIEFTYQVDGKQYVQRQTWPAGEEGFLGSTPAVAQEAKAKYFQGAVVAVYYDPKNPEEGVVETRVADFGWLEYPLGLGFMIGLASPIWGVVLIGKAIYRYVRNRRTRQFG
jgi:hypothetical protein